MRGSAGVIADLFRSDDVPGGTHPLAARTANLVGPELLGGRANVPASVNNI